MSKVKLIPPVSRSGACLCFLSSDDRAAEGGEEVPFLEVRVGEQAVPEGHGVQACDRVEGAAVRVGNSDATGKGRETWGRRGSECWLRGRASHQRRGGEGLRALIVLRRGLGLVGCAGERWG